MKRFTYILLLAAVFALSGCASDEKRESVYVSGNLISAETTSAAPARTEAPAETEAPATEPPAEVSAPTEETKSAEETFEETYEDTYETSETLDTFYIDEYAAYSLTPRERSFTRKSIFVGDSICRGFSEYNVVNSDRVYARGSVAARNFFEFAIFYGDEEIDLPTLLDRTKPEFVFFSMGMNDINLTDEETYCENYAKLIQTALDNSDALIFVSAITPIDSEFSTNYRIDCFNVRMEQFIAETYPERVYYLDFAKHLKDAEGNLKECFNGGDGIHLAPYAYYVALWEMNRAMKAEGIRW